MARSYSPLQWFSIFLIILIVLSFVGFLFGYVSQLWFWVIIACVAFLAYKVIPSLNTKR